jgi:hypothetical protein
MVWWRLLLVSWCSAGVNMVVCSRSRARIQRSSKRQTKKECVWRIVMGYGGATT